MENVVGLRRFLDSLELATAAHQGQVRKYIGIPYIMHPIEVARIVWGMTNGRASWQMLCAALLHDVLEDTNMPGEHIEFLIGKEVLTLVQELTQKSKPEDGNRAVRKKIDREFLWTVSSEAQTIKCADVVENCKTICEFDPNFAPLYIKECFELVEGFSKAIPGRTQALFTLKSFEFKNRRS